MRFGNRKGIAVIDDIIIIAVIGAVCYFVAPTVSKSISGIFGGADRVHKTSHTKASKEPVVLGVDEKGKNIIGYKTKDEASTEALSEEIQPTLCQKLKSVFWVIIGIAIFCAVFPASVMAKLKNRLLQDASDKLDALQAKHDELKSETVKVVQSVQAARQAVTDPVIKAAMTTAMDKTQNDTTKALVADIKANGTITQ